MDSSSLDNTPTREVRASSLVVFLVKSGRNPFESMITVGRATNNDHCLPLTTVSKVHAYFCASPGGAWRLHDQKATNGTFVDKQRLELGGSAALQDGSRIGFGPDARARFFTPSGLFGFLALFRSGLAMCRPFTPCPARSGSRRRGRGSARSAARPPGRA